jgi:hypothetical protein
LSRRLQPPIHTFYSKVSTSDETAKRLFKKSEEAEIFSETDRELHYFLRIRARVQKFMAGKFCEMKNLKAAFDFSPSGVAVFMIMRKM